MTGTLTARLISVTRSALKPPWVTPGAHPPLVDQKAVHEVQHKEDDEELPEAREKPPGAVDGVDEDQHVGDVDGQAHGLEAQGVFPDLLLCGEAQGDAALLHIRVVEMHHPHGPVPDADGADQHQNDPQANALHQNSQYHSCSLLTCLKCP